MIPPTWRSAWNNNGIVGSQEVYKFDNGLGAWVTRTNDGEVTVSTIQTWGGVEINNFILSESTPPQAVKDGDGLQSVLVAIRDRHLSIADEAVVKDEAAATKRNP